MKRRLRRFVLVGAFITLIDLAIFLWLGTALSERWVLADVVALAIAGVISFAVHRSITFQDDAYALIDHRAGSFALAALPAMFTDLLIVAVVSFGASTSVSTMFVVKIVAIGVSAAVRIMTYRGALFSAVRDRQQLVALKAPPGDVRVSVVLPAYRAADLIADSVERLRAALEPLGSDIEVVIVDDGSDDGTADAARAAGVDTVVELATNRGKGAAVRAGVLAARGRCIVFTDIDLAYPPTQIIDLVEQVEAGWQVVVGSRRHPDTRTLRRAGRFRELGSFGFNLLTYFVLLGNYRDTQCGLKAFRSDAAKDIFGRTIVDGFAFDVEVLHLAERLEFSLTELPVLLDHVEASTVRLVPQATKMLRDVLRVRRASALGQYGISR
jgi:putative flippase GtrA